MAAVLPIVALACGGGTALQLGDVTPESVPTLQEEHVRNPNDAMAATRLGVAYFRANQLDEARAILDTAVGNDARNGIAAIYRGMTAESQGDFGAARASYEQFIAVARSTELKGAARQRLALVDRRELEYSARQALSQEAQLSQTPPEPNTIAVMPFGYTGANADIQPLSRGFAQLVVTDLARSRQLVVLERERMQAMLDEMRLGEQGRADPQTAARSGRLLRAARVVQGTLTDTDNLLRADAAVVDAGTAEIMGRPAESADQLTRLFDMEKSLVIQLFREMNITLTDAERQAINARPTQSLQAFLAWSRGLEAEDRGDFVGAQDFYNQAVRIDPSFGAAAASAQNAADLQQATTQSVADVDALVSTNAAAETSGPGAGETQNQLTTATNETNPTATSRTDATQEATPTQAPADTKPTDRTGDTGVRPQSATVRVTIPRP